MAVYLVSHVGTKKVEVMVEDRIGNSQWPMLFEGKVYFDFPERITKKDKKTALYLCKVVERYTEPKTTFDR